MTEISTYVMPEHEAHRITEKIRYTAMTVRDNVAKLQELVAEAQEGQAHAALGYTSWTAYIADVFSDAPLQLQRQERREVVAWLSGEGMSTRAIAPIVGVSNKTVSQDRREVLPEVTRGSGSTLATRDGVIIAEQHRVDARTGEILDTKPITGMDGKTYNRPTPATPRTPPRRALTDQFFDAVYDMTKQIERVERLTNDDRFPANKEKVATKHSSDFSRAIDLLQEVANKLQ